MGPCRCDDNHRLGDEKYEADGEHWDSDGRGPGEVEVRARIENHECETAEEQDGAGPATETCGDFALALVLAAANLAHRRDGQTLMVIEATAKGGGGGGLVGGMLLRFRQGPEGSADGPAEGGASSG